MEIEEKIDDNCGIYIIKNKSTGKAYIGSSSNIKARKLLHFKSLRLNKHHSNYLQNSFNKYGEAKFEFTILEFCNKTKVELLQREQYYLDLLNPAYNILRIAGSRLGYKISEKTRQKLITSHLGQKSSRKGITLSEEIKKKMRKPKSQKGKENIRKAHNTLEYRENIKYLKEQMKKVLAKNRNKKPVVQLDIYKNKLQTFNSITEAATKLNILKTSINNTLRGKSKTAGGYKWKYN